MQRRGFLEALALAAVGFGVTSGAIGFGNFEIDADGKVIELRYDKNGYIIAKRKNGQIIGDASAFK